MRDSAIQQHPQKLTTQATDLLIMDSECVCVLLIAECYTITVMSDPKLHGKCLKTILVWTPLSEDCNYDGKQPKYLELEH